MHLDKEDVAARLRAEGDHDRALLAQTTLPKHVDPERDANLLHQLDLNVNELKAETAER